MKNIILLNIIFFINKINVLASPDEGILGGITVDKIRRGEIKITDIPKIIQYATEFLMGFAASVAIIFIIIGAYKYSFGALQNDRTRGKETVILGISGFILAALSWVILKVVVNNFS